MFGYIAISSLGSLNVPKKIVAKATESHSGSFLKKYKHPSEKNLLSQNSNI